MEYEIVGHGHFGETWGIEKGIIMGRPTTMPYGRSWTSWYLTAFCALRTAWG